MHLSNVTKTLKGFTSKWNSGNGSDPFNVRSAYAITLLLTALLWWLPIFGQMIAGYVGGRKSGSLVKGVIITLAAVATFVIVASLLSFLGLDMLELQATILGGALGGFPELEAFMVSLFSYLQGLFSTFGTFGSANAAIMIATIVFGAVGGIVSAQAASESGYRSPTGGSSAGSIRSLESYKAGRAMGFGSFDDYSSVSAMQAGRSEVVTAKTKKPVAEPEPVMVREKESPFSSVLAISDRQPIVEKQVVKDDTDYI